MTAIEPDMKSFVRLIEGDCIQELKKIDANSIDLVYCDLPYGTTQSSWDIPIPFDSMWDEILRIIKKNTVVVFHAQQPFTSALIMSNPTLFKYQWVWEKSKATGFLNAKRRPLVAHEDILIFCKGTPVYYPQMTEGQPYDKGLRKKQAENDLYGKYKQTHGKNEGFRYPRSVLYFKTAECEGPVLHRAQKPIALCEYIIKTYSLEGQTILDFTMGSARSGIAARKLNRNYIGIEKDPAIFKIAQEELEETCNLYFPFKHI